MKLLFLDIDGVVWTQGGVVLSRHRAGEERPPRYELDPVTLAVMGELVDRCDFKVVVTSTWRLSNTVEEMRDILGSKIGPRVIGVTPHLPGKESGREIEVFLNSWNEHYRGGPVDDFIIVDDDTDMSPFMGRLFKTDSWDGFKFRDYVAVIDYMKASPTRRWATRARKTVLYSLSRRFWRIYRPISWKVEQVKEKILAQTRAKS